MTQARALATFHTLWASECAFKRGDREQAWSLLEQAEQQIPQIEDVRLFGRAQRHANRVWQLAVAADVVGRVVVDRGKRSVSLDQSAISDQLVSDA